MVIGRAAYAIILGALVAERFFELAIARRNARIAFSRGAVEYGRGHYPVMVAMHAAFIASCAIEGLFFPSAIPAAIVWSAIACECGAQFIRYWVIATLGDRWNTRIIVTPGAAAITGGPFAIVRHPNYIAVVIEIAAVPLIGGAIVTACVFTIANLALLTVRIRAEERALGDDWARAFGVPRARGA
jgi:methyltransferase